MADIEIEFGRACIGAINIEKSPNNLHVNLTAAGFEIPVPIVLTMQVRTSDEPMVMIDNLGGKVLVKHMNGSSIVVGRLSSESRHTAGVTSEDSYDHSTETHLKWTGIFEDLAYIERLRDGQAPKLQMEVHGEWSFLLPAIKEVSESRWNELAEDQKRRIQGYSALRVRTEPHRIYSRTGFIDVSYPREVWIAMIRKLGIAENVLVEIPLPPSPKDPWTGVWKALGDARNAFEQGGSNAWQSTVTSVRLALERWRDVEQEDQGPGWKPPSRFEKESRTKKQRLDALRWHLMQAAHLGPHTGAEDWSRDDALLMLSTLSALLAERKP